MNIETITENEQRIAVVTGEQVELQDARTALDLILSVQYETGAGRVALDKAIVSEAFFVLSTGLAGEILQKFINYRVKVAIYGDYSRYTSKPLRDFIYESNNGRDIFFVATRDEAVAALAAH